MNTAEKLSNGTITQFELSKKLLNNLYKFNLKPVTKLVLLYLADCYNPKHGYMFPKQRTIADKLGVSERTVNRAVSELVKEGLILIEYKQYKLSASYKFTSRIVSEQAENKSFNNVTENHNHTTKNRILYKEQKKELNNPTKVEDDKILIDYAKAHGAKNVRAYIAKLKLNGSAEKIVCEQKKAQKVTQNALRAYEETQELISSWRAMDKEEDCPPTAIPAEFREYAQKRRMLTQK